MAKQTEKMLLDKYFCFQKNKIIFQDRDGSVANEFWEQGANGKIRRVKPSQLCHLGAQEYSIPRLAHTCPLVVCDNETLLAYLKRKYNYIDKYPSDYQIS